MKTKFNTKNSARALAYSIYMMVGSYFASAQVTNPLYVKKLTLSYKEEKKDHQIRMEGACNWLAAKKLKASLPERIWDEDVKVTFQVLEDGVVTVTFQGEDFKLLLGGTVKNGYVDFAPAIFRGKSPKKAEEAPQYSASPAA